MYSTVRESILLTSNGRRLRRLSGGGSGSGSDHLRGGRRLGSGGGSRHRAHLGVGVGVDVCVLVGTRVGALGRHDHDARPDAHLARDRARVPLEPEHRAHAAVQQHAHQRLCRVADAVLHTHILVRVMIHVRSVRLRLVKLRDTKGS